LIDGGKTILQSLLDGLGCPLFWFSPMIRLMTS
jgi:hypothetical protein